MRNIAARAGRYAAEIVSALRADLQSQVADLNSKLKLVSDQLAALSLLLKELRK